MLENAWLIPSIPAVSFLAILLFGKRSPKQGAAIGIAAVGASFLASCVAAVEWVQRVDDATGSSQGLAAFTKGIVSQAGSHHVVQPVPESVTWRQNGSRRSGVGTYVAGLPELRLAVLPLTCLRVPIHPTAC